MIRRLPGGIPVSQTKMAVVDLEKCTWDGKSFDGGGTSQLVLFCVFLFVLFGSTNHCSTRTLYRKCEVTISDDDEAKPFHLCIIAPGLVTEQSIALL